MRFTFDQEQLAFQASVRALLDKHCTGEQLRLLWESDTGRSRQRWRALANIGLLGILVGESHAGLGMNECDLVLGLEEGGRAALPEPLVESAVVAPLLLAGTSTGTSAGTAANADADADADAGASASADIRASVGAGTLDESVRGQWLAAIASGKAMVSVGHPINPCVCDAHVADLLLLERDGEIHALLPDEVELETQPCSDLSRRLFTLSWQPSAATLLAGRKAAAPLLDAALDHGAFGVAAQQLGIAQRLIDLAVEYAKEREQFGKPIGSFQAIKHVLANVQVKLEFARPAVYRAAHSLAASSPSRSIDVSMAKAAADEGAVAAAKTALQVHGAIGYTWEVDLHLWMKRAWALQNAWGSTRWHRRRVGAALFDGSAPVPSFGFEAQASERAEERA